LPLGDFVKRLLPFHIQMYYPNTPETTVLSESRLVTRHNGRVLLMLLII
jgi:hypothetical protein